MDNDYPKQPMDDLDYHGQTHHPHFSGQRKKSKKLVWVALIAALVVIVGGGAAYLILGRQRTPAATTPHISHKANSPQLPSGVQANGNSYTYKSTKLKLGVTYPKTWNMRESADKQEIILTSPQTTYVKKGGTSTDGVITVKLRNGIIPDAIKTTVQNGVAVADSQVIAYSNPTGDQRQYTNLSYVGPNASDFAFALVTGYTEYKAGQAVGGGIDLNGQAYMFAAGYGADSADALNFELVPKADYDTDTFQEAVAILESLQIY